MRRRITHDFGALLLDKPRGPSSHELVQWVRWSLGTTSVGHCGTLDPDASGLMILLVGKATRLASRLSDQQKGYDAVFSLGAQTDTDDAQGQVIARAPVSPTQLEAARALLDGGWEGTHQLAPPRYSAVRVQGVRAHTAARKGEDLELALREMTVLCSRGFGDDPSSWLGERSDRIPDCHWLGAQLDVSKGSYIRSLALELGRRIDAPVHLAALRRRSSGKANLQDPKVVRDLSALPWTAAANGAPRWRIRWGEGGKSEQAHKIRAAMVDPFPLLEHSLHRAQSFGAERRAMAEPWFQGQSVPVEAWGRDLPAERNAVIWLDERARQAVLLRRDPADHAGPERWAPELVLRWPAPPSEVKKLPEEARKP